MGLFDRLRLGARRREESPTTTEATPEQDALCLIDEGNALEDAGRFQDALERYEAAIRLAPNPARAHLNRGNALLALGDQEGASGAYATALVHDPDYAAAHYNLGNAYVRSNRREDALVTYRRALALKPDFADAEVALGALYADLGQGDDAAASYRRALHINPAYAAVHGNLGNVLQDLGQLEEAITSYRRMLEIEPQNVLAHNNLGIVHVKQGKLDEAVACYRKAIELAPDYVDAHINLGAACGAQGEFDRAVACYQEALSLSPDSPFVRFTLGNMFFEQGKLEESIACYREAVELKPDFSEAHSNLGNALRDEERLNEAIACYEEALKFKPDFPEAYSNVGNALWDQGRRDEAAACYRKAIELKPNFPEAHNNLGDVLKSKGLLDEAIACYKKAIELKPDFPEAHFHLGNALLDQDRVGEALGCYQNALLLRPEYAEARWSLVASQLPAVYEAGADPGLNRTAFSLELEKLHNWFDAPRIAKNFNSVRIQTPFYLAYQEENNRDLLRRHGSLCTRIMAEWLGRQALPLSGRRETDGVIHIGIVSHHLRNHSVWHAIVKGWFQQLDRKRFALHAFHLRTEQDQETLFAKSHASHFEQGERKLRQWVETIVGQQPDVLVYPEIGMESMAGRLASLRLARVQVATWGHPETTGLPTIDYYLSAEDLEPASAQENYTEHLVTLPRLGCFYESYEIVAAQPDLAKLGIDPKSPLLLCPGVPYKYAPQHDWVFAEIARRLGRCQFVFFTYQASPNMSAKLRQRLKVEFARNRLDLDEFATFIPWQTWPGFFGLLERADVFLDTIGFSGFNTAMQAVECGLPIVTREGRFLRGRLASGILKRIGLQELVAQSDEDYVALIVKLAQDAAYREHIGERIEASRQILFEDSAPIRALEDFFVRATMEAKTRGRLGDGLV